MADFKTVCVYCGSSMGTCEDYKEAAYNFGKTLAERGHNLVYGGGKVGLMGTVADGAMSAGAQVTGIITEKLKEKEVGHHGITELITVQTMHQRKQMMAEHADAFVALPGGIGTFEELFEVLTWNQLKYHQKPCGILNVAGYYDDLARFLRHVVTEGFLKDRHLQSLAIDSDPTALLGKMSQYVPDNTEKWL